MPPVEDAVTEATGTTDSVKIAFETSDVAHATPELAAPHEPTKRTSEYGRLLPAPDVGVHHVTVVAEELVTIAPVGYVPASPPVQPVNAVFVALTPVHVTDVCVVELANEIVFDPDENAAVLATLIVPAGSVTALASVVLVHQPGNVSVIEDVELTVVLEAQ